MLINFDYCVEFKRVISKAMNEADRLKKDKSKSIKDRNYYKGISEGIDFVIGLVEDNLDFNNEVYTICGDIIGKVLDDGTIEKLPKETLLISYNDDHELTIDCTKHLLRNYCKEDFEEFIKTNSEILKVIDGFVVENVRVITINVKPKIKRW